MSIAAITTPTKFLHSNNGQLTVSISAAEAEFNIRSVDLTIETASDETTSSADNGWFSAIPGNRKVSGSIVFEYDLTNAPASSPYALKVATYAALKIILNGHTGANLDSGDITSAIAFAGSALLSNFKCKPGPAANGPLECSMDFVSQGAWTGPIIA